MILNKTKYSRFNPDKLAVDKDSINNFENVKVRVKFRGQNEESMPFSFFKTCLNPNYVSKYQTLVAGYCKLFGNQFAKNVYLKF